MRCARCGTESIPGKKFCHACGARLELRCPSCGAPVEPTYRFCPDCGTSLEAPAPPEAPAAAPPVPPPPAADARLERFSRHIPEALARKILAAKGSVSGERKLVTVLFCDLVGSTALASGLDPEEYHDILEKYLELAFQEIYRFEGIVNQIAGDGLMALFGAPVAHEDAPHRALRAALAIRDSLERFNERARAAGRPELRARIGIHTGPVVVGTVGNDFKMDYTAIGDTTNLASRLQTLAEPGTVLASEATHRLVRGFFKVRQTGPFEIRGKTEPVVVYEVLGAADAATPMTIAEARGLTPFVGRDSELRQLASCFDLLGRNLPQVVSVVGDAGSGKSRLLYEFRQRVLEGRATLFEARCSSMTQSLPYAPWVGMLKQFFAMKTCEPPACTCERIADRLREIDPSLEQVYPYLCRLLSLPIDGIGDRPPEEIKGETFEAMAKLVVAASQKAPAVLIIEDLHWIDEPSREMLELAVAELHHVPVMIAVSHRPDYLPTWRARVAFTQLNLRRLEDDELREIVRSIAGGPLPEALERVILFKAEGNPFFAEEITRALVDEGYLLRGERHVRLTRPVAQIRIPDTIQELIGARLDRLAPAAKRTVQVAAVIGRQFRRAELERLLAAEGVDVARELGELELAGILHRKNVLSDDEFRFGESLTQEVAYEGLLLKERRQLHERIALLLEAEPNPSADHSALLAHHFVRSDNRQKAMDALLRAAADAEKLPSFRSAARFYRQAWEIADSGLGTAEGDRETFRRSAVEAALGLCRMAVIYGSSDPVATEKIAPRAAEIAESLGDRQKVAGLSVFRGLALASAEREKFGEGVSLIEQGLAAAQAIGDGVATVSVARGLTWAYVLDGKFDLAGRSLAKMIDTLERSGDRERLSDTYFGVLFLRNGLYYFSDELDAAFEGARVTYDLAVRASNRTVQSGSMSWLASVHFGRAEYAPAKEWADRALEIAERIGNLSAIRGAAMIALGARFELGETADLSRYLSLVEQDFAGRGDMALKSHAIADVYLSLGEVERAHRFVEAAFPYAGGRLREMICATASADVLRELGSEHHGRAVERYLRAVSLAEEIGQRSTWALAVLGQAQLAGAEGDREGAATKARKALEVFRELRLVRYQRRAEDVLRRLTAAA